ncbi:methyltransferase, FxLD system [Nocardiopsis dassonvillei]|uniref:methyltransferase, FxLD system n=1 Tax=Nocardiopsis dassonvillei TaxID=2014 RepID=UPI0020A2DFB6|nr:methyltransferase, FxLD system [Nocardiopsis dassonvillei]MCP3013048.1 methyltransferase, FxLD system [Nocardiopsis dassonvillei]
MGDEQPQILIQWVDWAAAEHWGVHGLGPALEGARKEGLIPAWWFVRKKPHWRLRYTGGRPARQFLDTELERLHAEGAVTRWVHGIYEPETGAFGGPAGMALAHAVFGEDSRHLLAYLGHRSTMSGTELGRRELALLLGSSFLRGARLDWFEQADVWAKVAALRALPQPFSAEEELVSSARTLMTLSPRPLIDSGPLRHTSAWAQVFTAAGAALTDLAAQGRLNRGLRAVCAHHLIFAFNRWGLPYRDQHILSTTARKAAMTDTNHRATPESAQALREELIRQLRKDGVLTTPAVEGAFRAVPRHAFVPNATLEEAYTNAPVHIKHDDNGASISCGSQPGVVATMLEQAALEPGMRVLELGAGTGYNAALLGHLVGPTGSVTTIDVDQDLVEGACARLKENGATNVTVVLGDGALGHPDGAPFDRIIATVGCHDVPRAWVDQLAPGGRLIAPVRIAGDVSRSIVFEARGDHWASVDSQLCTFMPLRGGVGDDPRRILALDGDGTVMLQANQDQSIAPEQVDHVLIEPSATTWTGVNFGKGQPLDPMWLWLSTRLDNRVSRMPVQPQAVASDLVSPGLPWGDMASVPAGERGLAYLTMRPVAGQQGRHEVGVIGHAHTGQKLAEQMAEHIRAWEPHRAEELSFALHYNAVPEPSTVTRRVLARAHSTLVVSWGEPV